MYQGTIDIKPAELHIIRNDRLRFLPILRTIANFAAKNGGILAGQSVIRRITGKEMPLISQYTDAEIEGLPVDWSYWQIEIIFSVPCREKMISLMDTLAKDPILRNMKNSFDLDTLALYTVEYDKEYEFRIMGRLLARGITMNIDINSPLFVTMGPNPFDTDNIKELSPELLMYLNLRPLIDPSKTALWNVLLQGVLDLANLREKKILGSEIKAGQHFKKIDGTDPIVFLKKNFVHIGDPGVAFYLNWKKENMREQYIGSFDDETFRTYARNFGFEYIPSQLYAPDDFRLLKVTLRKGTNSIDVFNAGSYDPIPYCMSKKGHMIGSPLVILRFLFIEIWALAHLKNGSDGINRRIEYLRLEITNLLNFIKKCPQEILFPIDYIGTFKLEKRARAQYVKKNLMKKTEYVDISPKLFIEGLKKIEDILNLY